MTLLEVITKASINQQETLTPPQSNYPIILNSDDILLNLKPQSQDSDQVSLIKRVEGWTISETDIQIIQIGNDFCKKLKRKLKNPNLFTKDEFFKVFNSFLEKNRLKFGFFEKIEGDGEGEYGYSSIMVKKLGFLISPNVASLVLESCVSLEIWGFLEVLIVEGVLNRVFSSGNLIESLVEKKKSDLICLCVKSFSKIPSSDIHLVLKYFLSPPKGANSTMVNVRKEWEGEALLAIEKVSDSGVSGENLVLAKQVSVLLMVAYDEFSSAELCLHYLFASSEIDELTLSYSLSELNGYDMLKLIRYFGKWLKKYLKFPQAGPCPNAVSVLGLRLCEWVPSLESVVKYLGLVLDEHFSSLVLYSEFHDELRSLEEDVKSLASEARTQI